MACRLSAFVLTKNESANIERCLRALDFCDEVVVVDSGSEDGTRELAARFTERVLTEPWRGFAAQRQFALEQCRGDWVLWVDADEVVTPDLAETILTVTRASAPSGEAAFRVKRQVFYLGAWMRHGGWGADWVVRLFLRERAHFPPRVVHESVEVDGKLGTLEGTLEHYSYRDLSHHWRKIDEWSRLAALEAHGAGRRARLWDLALRPLARWCKIYVIRLGALDGWRGWVVAGMGAAYVFQKYARLRELREEAARPTRRTS